MSRLDHWPGSSPATHLATDNYASNTIGEILDILVTSCASHILDAIRQALELVFDLFQGPGKASARDWIRRG